MNNERKEGRKYEIKFWETELWDIHRKNKDKNNGWMKGRKQWIKRRCKRNQRIIERKPKGWKNTQR